MVVLVAATLGTVFALGLSEQCLVGSSVSVAGGDGGAQWRRPQLLVEPAMRAVGAVV